MVRIYCSVPFRIVPSSPVPYHAASGGNCFAGMSVVYMAVSSNTRVQSHNKKQKIDGSDEGSRSVQRLIPEGVRSRQGKSRER